MPRWLAVSLALALALWTAAIVLSYLPAGFGGLWPDFVASLPPASGYTLRPWLLDFVAAVLLAFAAYGHGAYLSERMRLESVGAERVVVAAALGFAALLVGATLLGIVGLFRPGLLRIVMIAFVASGIWRCRFHTIALDRGAIAPVVLTVLFAAIALICAAAPETAYDALSWHLPTSRFFLQQGRFAYMELYRSNVPQYGEILYALGLSLHKTDLAGESGARMFNFLVLPGVLLATAALTARLAGNKNAGAQALAALFVASSPVVINRASTCYPDLGASLWAVLALIAFLEFHETRRGVWIALCGLFAGMAAGSKFVGFYWIAIGGSLVTVAAFLDRERIGRRGVIRAAAVFAIVSGAVCSPWLIRNLIYTGDPLIPTLQKILPHPRMDLREVTNIMLDANNRDRIPASLANYLALPWRLTMEGERWQGTIGPVFLWLAPFWLIGVRRSRTWMWVSAVLLVFSAMWLKGPQWARYYLPALPIIAALGAAGLSHERVSRWMRAAAITAAVLLSLVNIPGLNRNWVSGGSFVTQEIPWNVALGSQTEDSYRRINVMDYDAAVFVNRQPASATAAVLAVPMFNFFPQWLTRPRVLDVFENAQAVCLDDNRRLEACYHLKGPTMQRNMDRLGIEFLSVHRDADWSTHRDALRLEDPFFRRYFRLLGYVAGNFLYARDRNAPAPGMIYVNADLTSRWAQREAAGSSGRVELLQQGPDAADGRFALRFSGESSAWFDVTLGSSPELVFSAAQDLRYEQEDLSGALEVFVDGAPAFEYMLSPQDFLHRWHEFRVDLSRFAGKAARVQIRLKPGNAGERPALAIADAVIYARETTQPIPEEGQRWLFNTATTHHPVDVRFTPGTVRPGASYVLEVPALAGEMVDLLYSMNGGEPGEALRFRRLDSDGRVTVNLSKDFTPVPATLEVVGVRKSGDALWLAAKAKIEVVK